MIWASGWFWVIVGVALMLAEMILPGFILLGFGISGVIVGVLTWTGVLGGSLAVTALVFALLAGIAWLGLHRMFSRPDQRPKIVDRDINEN